MNNTTLVGRLTKDVELKNSANGKSFASFSLAVRKPFAVQGENDADFIPCVVFGKTAQNMAQYLSKGSLVSVQGHLSTHTYTAKDGSKRFAMEVIADQVGFLNTKPQQGTKKQPSLDDAFAVDAPFDSF